MARLILAIISTLFEETALVAIVLWALPRIDIHIPVPGLVALMLAWLAYTVFTYRIGSRALKKPLIHLPDMVGCKGAAVIPLAPAGLVKIKGELWVAKSSGGEIPAGGEVVVVGQEGLKLVVDGGDTTRDGGKTE